MSTQGFNDIIEQASAAAYETFLASTKEDGIDVYNSPMHFARRAALEAAQQLLKLANDDLEKAFALIPDEMWSRACAAMYECGYELPKDRRSQLDSVLAELVYHQANLKEPYMIDIANERDQELS